VRYVIVLEGITDIDRQHEANLPDYKLTAEDPGTGIFSARCPGTRTRRQTHLLHHSFGSD